MAAAYGLYTHIQSNRRRSILLLIGLFFLVYVMVFAGALAAEAMSYDASLQWLVQRAWIDAVKAAPFATIGAALWIFLAYRFNQSLVDMVTGGREVTRQEEPRLYNLLENLCISRGITVPKLKTIETPALNAFASGMNEKQYSVTVTSGLLQALAIDIRQEHRGAHLSKAKRDGSTECAAGTGYQGYSTVQAERKTQRTAYQEGSMG